MIIDARERFEVQAINAAGAEIARAISRLRPVSATELLAVMLGELVADNIDDANARLSYLCLMHSMSTAAAELYGPASKG